MTPYSPTPILISGSDTGAGKTVVTVALAAYLQQHFAPQSVAICKPVQSGEGDREFYAQTLALSQPPDTLNPQFFHTPVAPPLAAAIEGRSIDLGGIWQTLEVLRQDFKWVLVEGVGGLGTPLTHEWTVAHLAQAWRLPVVLVLPVRLGSIGQAVALAALAQQHQLQIRGFILSCPEPLSAQACNALTPISLIESLTRLPVLGTLDYCPDITDCSTLAQSAAALDLETIFSLRPVISA